MPLINPLSINLYMTPATAPAPSHGHCLNLMPVAHRSIQVVPFLCKFDLRGLILKVAQKIKVGVTTLLW